MVITAMLKQPIQKEKSGIFYLFRFRINSLSKSYPSQELLKSYAMKSNHST